jgi:hypothetical protein
MLREMLRAGLRKDNEGYLRRAMWAGSRKIQNTLTDKAQCGPRTVCGVSKGERLPAITSLRRQRVK